MTRVQTGESRVQIQIAARIFFFSKMSRHGILNNGENCSFSRIMQWGMKLTTKLHLMPKLRMSGNIPLFPVQLHGMDWHSFAFLSFT
jgi:hypothetical protein